MVTAVGTLGKTYVVKDGDTIATVYGSGDFALDAVFHGAREVVGFDINEFQYPVGAFKTMSLEILSYSDYFTFFQVYQSFYSIVSPRY